MGGRGAQLKSKPIVMDLEDYLIKKGVLYAVSDYLLDKVGGDNQRGMTQRARRRFERESEKNINNYHERRLAAIAEYDALVASGKVRGRTLLEESMLRARGNEERPSTQAARRIVAKMGYDWKTGKKLK